MTAIINGLYSRQGYRGTLVRRAESISSKSSFIAESSHNFSVFLQKKVQITSLDPKKIFAFVDVYVFVFDSNDNPFLTFIVVYIFHFMKYKVVFLQMTPFLLLGNIRSESRGEFFFIAKDLLVFATPTVESLPLP